MKVGLFFGSFNPIHIGHMIIANIMCETTDLDKVWFVVSPQNPLKRNKNLLHEFDRIQMVEAAIADNYKLKCTDIEFRMPKPSYTVDTMTYLSDKNQDKKFVLIIGEDNFLTFGKWKNYQAILENFELYVYPRPGAKQSALIKNSNVKKIKAPVLNISATFIRSCVSKNQSIRYLVPDPVAKLIDLKCYYKSAAKL